MEEPHKFHGASMGLRLLAALVDWACLVAASYIVFPLLLLLAGFSGWWCLIGAFALSLATMALCWAYSRSPGLAITSIRLVRKSDGRPPGVWRAVARSLLIYPGGSAAVALALIAYAARMGHYPSGATPSYSTARIAVLALMASTYLGMALVALIRPRRQALYDRLLGIEALEPRRAPSIRPTPAPKPPRPPRIRQQRSRWWLIPVGVISLWEFIFFLSLGMAIDEAEYGAAVVIAIFMAVPGWLAFELLRRMSLPRWMAVGRDIPTSSTRQ